MFWKKRSRGREGLCPFCSSPTTIMPFPGNTLCSHCNIKFVFNEHFGKVVGCIRCHSLVTSSMATESLKQARFDCNVCDFSTNYGHDSTAFLEGATAILMIDGSVYIDRREWVWARKMGNSVDVGLGRRAVDVVKEKGSAELDFIFLRNSSDNLQLGEHLNINTPWADSDELNPLLLFVPGVLLEVNEAALKDGSQLSYSPELESTWFIRLRNNRPYWLKQERAG